MNANPSVSPDPASSAPFFAKERTKRRNPTLGIVGLLATIAASATGRWFLASSAAAHAPKPEAPLPVSVRTLVVAEEVVAQGLRYSGLTKELQKAELSFRVAGTVASLHKVAGPGGRLRDVFEGDTLDEGTVIARLDPGDYARDRGQAAERVATAKAQLSQAKANLEQAQVDFRRMEQLAQRNSATAADLDNARTKLKASQATAEANNADLASASIGLEQAEANLKYCSIAAPFPRSTIAAREVDNGERVAPNQKVFTIVDVSSVVVEFNVPDSLVGRLSFGQGVEVATDALPGQRFAGVIHKIASTADPRTRTYPIEVRVDEPRELRPGMVATVIFRKEVKAHLLPLTSVAHAPSGGGLMVYRVVQEDGHAVARQVPVAFTDVLDNKVVVRESEPGGLRSGDVVVATGLHRLRDGQAVRVIE